MQKYIYNFIIVLYRNTTHPSTGRLPAELMMARPIRTRLPCLQKTIQQGALEKAREQDMKTRQERKIRFDRKKKTVEKVITVGDKVVVKQEELSTKPPFDPIPYEVVDVKDNRVTVSREGKLKKRSMNKVEKIA